MKFHKFFFFLFCVYLLLTAMENFENNIIQSANERAYTLGFGARCSVFNGYRLYVCIAYTEPTTICVNTFSLLCKHTTGISSKQKQKWCTRNGQKEIVKNAEFPTLVDTKQQRFRITFQCDLDIYLFYFVK